MTSVSTTFILPDLAGGGAQRVMLSISGAIDTSKITPSIIVIGNDNTLIDDVPSHNQIINGRAKRLRDGLPWLIRQIRQSKPDVIVSVMGYLNLTLLSAKLLLPKNTRIIVREANVLSSTMSALPNWLPARRLYRSLYPRAHAIVSPTKSIAQEIGDAAPRARNLLHVISNPVNIERLRRRAASPKRTVGNGLRLVCAGRLTHQKGFDRLIKLVPDFPEKTHITIFGDGPDELALRSLLTGNNLKTRVDIRGFTHDLPAWIAGADAFLLPSRWEGLPNVVLESLALGTPAIVSNEAVIDDLAASTPRHALSIVPVNEKFTGAIAALKPKENLNGLSPSLLPQAYTSQSVAKQWQQLISSVASSNRT